MLGTKMKLWWWWYSGLFISIQFPTFYIMAIDTLSLNKTPWNINGENQWEGRTEIKFKFCVPAVSANRTRPDQPNPTAQRSWSIFHILNFLNFLQIFCQQVIASNKSKFSVFLKRSLSIWNTAFYLHLYYDNYLFSVEFFFFFNFQ